MSNDNKYRDPMACSDKVSIRVAENAFLIPVRDRENPKNYKVVPGRSSRTGTYGKKEILSSDIRLGLSIPATRTERHQPGMDR